MVGLTPRVNFNELKSVTSLQGGLSDRKQLPAKSIRNYSHNLRGIPLFEKRRLFLHAVLVLWCSCTKDPFPFIAR